MRPNLRYRNVAINSYVGMLVVAITASFAALYILHIGLEVPFKAFASAYDSGSTL